MGGGTEPERRSDERREADIEKRREKQMEE